MEIVLVEKTNDWATNDLLAKLQEIHYFEACVLDLVSELGTDGDLELWPVMAFVGESGDDPVHSYANSFAAELAVCFPPRAPVTGHPSS